MMMINRTTTLYLQGKITKNNVTVNESNFIPIESIVTMQWEDGRPCTHGKITEQWVQTTMRDLTKTTHEEGQNHHKIAKHIKYKQCNSIQVHTTSSTDKTRWLPSMVKGLSHRTPHQVSCATSLYQLSQ